MLHQTAKRPVVASVAADLRTLTYRTRRRAREAIARRQLVILGRYV